MTTGGSSHGQTNQDDVSHGPRWRRDERRNPHTCKNLKRFGRSKQSGAGRKS